jgi:signal transduction histidine kinase/predicted ATPase
VLREERTYHICKALAQTVDPNGHPIARPLDRLRLPGQGEDGPVSVCIFEDPGPNYLSRVVDYGPAWFSFHAQGDGIHGYPNRKFVLESMTLQTFLDFAIGAAECIEVLHGQQIVHGEVRGDAFHMNAELGRVTLINIGPGRLRTFEHGLTSTGWSTMSKELGAKTKLSYMSPEQTGRMPLEPDSRTDIFSLGVLFWTVLSQKPAFGGETPMDIIQAVLGQQLPLISNIRLDIPEVLGRIIQKATAKRVWDRYHSVSGLRYDLVEVRRLLGVGDSSQLPKWEIATKDVSPSFVLPQAMVGRASEHETLVRVIDHAFKIRQASQRQDKQGTPQLSRLSEDHFATFEVATTVADASLEDGNESSTDGKVYKLSVSDATSGEPRTYKPNTGKLRSRANSPQDSANIYSPSSPNSNSKLSETRISRSLESSSVESINGDGDSSMSGSESTGGMFMIRNNTWIRANRRCEVITIAGAAGLGKSRLVQSVQVEARQWGYFASSKFDQTQADNKPFQSVLKLLSSLFQQVFSENNMDPIFHQILKRRVTPVWSMLHKRLGLPEILFGPKLPVRTASQSSRYTDSLGSETRRRDLSPKSTSSRGGPPNKIGSQSSHNFLLAGSSTQSVSLMKLILDILHIFARYKSICFCLDDLHLADKESLELIAQIVSTRVKMVIIVTYNQEHGLSDTMRRILDPLHDEGTSLTCNIPDVADHGLVNTATGDIGVTPITLKPLSESDTMEYVAATLRRPKSEILPLGAIVHSKAAGNPFYIKEMLNACYRKKCVWYDFRESSWLFDHGSVLKHFDTEIFNDALYEGLVMSRLNELPAATKSILAWASMLGSSFSFQLIQRLLNGEHTPPKLLHSEHDSVKGLQAAIQAYILLPTQDDDIFLFAHDRYILAAASFKKDDENLMRFVIAQTLVEYYFFDDNYRNIAASSICELTSTIKSSVAHRKTFRRVLIEWARSACESGVRLAAAKVYASCIELLQDDLWNSRADDVSYEETLQIYTGAAECYLYCGQYQDARRLLLSVSSNAKTAVDKAPAWILQSRASAQEGDSTSAFQALKKCLLAFQIKVDDDPTFPKCDAEFKRLCQEIQSSDTAALVRKPISEDGSNLAAVGAVLAEASSAAFWSDTLFFYQMTLIMVDTYLTLGSFPQAGLGFLQLALIAITRHNMINLADDCGNVALALVERWKDPYTIGRAGTLYPTFLGHIQRPLHTTIQQLEGALDFAIQAGDRISTILNIGLVGNLKFFASENLAELELYSTYACQDIPNWQSDTPGGTMIITICQICRALQGKTHTMDPSVGVMSDARHNSPKYKSWLIKTVKNSDRPLLLYESIEIAPLFLYGHYASAVMLGNSCLKKINAIWSARNTRFLMFFQALSLAGSIWIRVQEQLDSEYRRQSPQLSSDVGGRSLEAGLQEEMAGLAMLMKYFNRRIEQWQAVTDVNYLAWSKMLAAQIAEMEDDHTAALRRYEEAIDHASTHNFIFEEALANQLLGGHLLRLGSRRLARMAFLESIALYRRFGATGVASHIEQEHHLILQASRPRPLTAEIGIQTDSDKNLEIIHPHVGFGYGGSRIAEFSAENRDLVEDRIGMWQEGSALVDTGSGPALHMLDLTSILESSQVLSSVLQVDQLLKTMCEIILENCKGVASLVAVVIEDPSIGWVIAASGCPEEGAEAHIPAIPFGKSALIVESVVNYCSRVREPMFLPDLMVDTRFSNVNGTWLARNPGSKSVIAIPICHGDNDKPLLGVLYMEGQPHAFTNRNLEVLQLLVNQIGISYSNSLTLKEVERVSAINKSMVEVQKKALAEAIEARNNANMAKAEAFRSAKSAEEADRAKTTFLANISHELRTPLNGVIGNSELLLFDNQLQEQQAEMADSIRISASLLLRLINDILDFAKIEANQMQLHPTVFSVHELLQELVRSIPNSRKQNSPQVKIVQDFRLDHSLVYGDPIRLHQILGNLVSNSLKFTTKGSITIGAKADWEAESETHLTFWTKDTGIGIPAEQLHKLFKPFSQADTTTSRKYGGSGLGLSICKSLVESMGGTINLKSTESVGTTVSFSLTLPKAKPEVSMGITRIKSDDLHTLSTAEQTKAGFSSLSDMPQSQIRVCIAEDNFINQKIAIQFLKKLKFKQVDAYNNGLEAVEGIQKMAKEGRPYHMILMDVQMPILDGYDATKLLRKDSMDAVQGILVIALTASAVQGDREKCLASGMNDYMAKPVRLAQLKEKFSEYMKVQ